MSAAIDKGYTRGREYLRQCKIETLTFEEYKNLGRVDVKRQYKQKKAQDAYLLGWWHAGEQFASLFKPDDNDSYSALKQMKSLQQRLGIAARDLDGLLDWREDDEILQDYLWKAYEAIGLALEMLDLAKEKAQ